MKLFYRFPAQSLYMHISFNFMFFSCTISTNEEDDDYSLYNPCNHSLYIEIIIFLHIDNPQSTDHRYKKESQKVRAPSKLTYHWR